MILFNSFSSYFFCLVPEQIRLSNNNNNGTSRQNSENKPHGHRNSSPLKDESGKLNDSISCNHAPSDAIDSTNNHHTNNRVQLANGRDEGAVDVNEPSKSGPGPLHYEHLVMATSTGHQSATAGVLQASIWMASNRSSSRSMYKSK